MDNITVCYCKKTDYGTIIKAKENGADSFEKIKEATGAGAACGRCKTAIENIIKE